MKIIGSIIFWISSAIFIYKTGIIEYFSIIGLIIGTLFMVVGSISRR